MTGEPNVDESAPLILATNNDESKDGKGTAATTTDPAGEDATFTHKLREYVARDVENSDEPQPTDGPACPCATLHRCIPA